MPLSSGRPDHPKLTLDGAVGADRPCEAAAVAATLALMIDSVSFQPADGEAPADSRDLGAFLYLSLQAV